MRRYILAQAIRTALIAGAALAVASCGGGGASNDTNGSGGGASNASGGGADSFDNAAKNADYGDNEMDSNVAQLDAANSTTINGKN